MNEDVSPIENGDFPTRHVSGRRGTCPNLWSLTVFFSA